MLRSKWGNPPDLVFAQSVRAFLFQSGCNYYSGYECAVSAALVGATELLAVSELPPGLEWAGTVGRDGQILVVRGFSDSVTPAIKADAVCWLHTHPGMNQVAPSAEDLEFTARVEFRNLDMVIVSRGADGVSVAQLMYTPDEQNQLRSLLDWTATGLDRYTTSFVACGYAKYQAAGYSHIGTDLELLMSHVGFVPN